jgi:hypothetical protein
MFPPELIAKYKAFVQDWPGDWEVMRAYVPPPSILNKNEPPYAVTGVYHPRDDAGIFTLLQRGKTPGEAYQKLCELIQRIHPDAVIPSPGTRYDRSRRRVVDISA